MKNKIDFVLPWVDGNCNEWLNEKSNYSDPGNSDINKYRDWNTLKYLFRSIEKNANWFNKLYFVTYGHVPEWLNINHPKIKIIKHSDYIKKEYLPTFNSNVLDLNLHNIKELSEQFVLFNDDVFLLQPLNSTDFFKDGLPRDFYSENVDIPYEYGDTYEHFLVNNMSIINKYFSKKDRKLKNISKYLNIRYGVKNINTILLSHWNRYSGFINPHLTQNFLKSTFIEITKKEPLAFNITYKNKFRNYTDINIYLIRYWQLLSGNFKPQKQLGKYLTVSDNNSEIINIISNLKEKIVCINDINPNINFQKAQNELIVAFENIFPDKSTFEL